VVGEEEAHDFVHQMYVAVVEECALWELPRGSTDMLPGGPVVHGPWDPDDCAELVMRWVERGWVELYLPDVPSRWELKEADWLGRAARRGGLLVLDRKDAMALLRDSTRWKVDGIDGHAALSRTELGMSVPASDWSDRATM
jgi:hypothetical protein